MDREAAFDVPSPLGQFDGFGLVTFSSRGFEFSSLAIHHALVGC
jgi:hypothetical protein